MGISTVSPKWAQRVSLETAIPTGFGKREIPQIDCVLNSSFREVPLFGFLRSTNNGTTQDVDRRK